MDYLFLDRARFEQRVEEGGFLEHAEVHGNLYGSPRDGIEQQLVQTRAVLLLIDVQGARKLRQDGVDTLQIFLEPPGLEELRRRIEMRGVENEEMVDLRLRNALSEMEQKDGYDHCVVNEVLDDTVEEVASIIEEEAVVTTSSTSTPSSSSRYCRSGSLFLITSEAFSSGSSATRRVSGTSLATALAPLPELEPQPARTSANEIRVATTRVG
mgnify:CR=1 FL=1